MHDLWSQDSIRNFRESARSMRWETNLAAVWGQMATGGGHAMLQETMSVLGVPTMTKKSFMTTERDIGEWWKAKK